MHTIIFCLICQPIADCATFRPVKRQEVGGGRLGAGGRRLEAGGWRQEAECKSVS